MAKITWLPSTILLATAVVLSFLVALGLPWLPALDIARVSATDLAKETFKDVKTSLAKDIRFGIWTACAWDFSGDKLCAPRGAGYEYPLGIMRDITSEMEIVTLTAGWTQGLAIHPVVTGLVASAFLASLSARHTVNLLTPLICALAAAVALIAFAIDLALFLRVRALVGNLGKGHELVVTVAAGPGFWLSLVVLVECLVVAAILFIARRREVKGESAYPMLSTQSQEKGFFKRFRK